MYVKEWARNFIESISLSIYLLWKHILLLCCYYTTHSGSPATLFVGTPLLSMTWHLLSARTKSFDSKFNACSSMSATKETEILIQLSLNSKVLPSAKELLALQTALGIWIGFIKATTVTVSAQYRRKFYRLYVLYLFYWSSFLCKIIARDSFSF